MDQAATRSKRARPAAISGGTMRLGAYPCRPGARQPGAEIYGADLISERHRHRYEVNINYRDKLEDAWPEVLRHVARRRAAGDRGAADHPWFIGVQFHPS
jgi:CTP synthase